MQVNVMHLQLPIVPSEIESENVYFLRMRPNKDEIGQESSRITFFLVKKIKAGIIL